MDLAEYAEQVRQEARTRRPVTPPRRPPVPSDGRYHAFIDFGITRRAAPFLRDALRSVR